MAAKDNQKPNRKSVYSDIILDPPWISNILPSERCPDPETQNPLEVLNISEAIENEQRNIVSRGTQVSTGSLTLAAAATRQVDSTGEQEETSGFVARCMNPIRSCLQSFRSCSEKDVVKVNIELTPSISMDTAVGCLVSRAVQTEEEEFSTGMENLGYGYDPNDFIDIDLND